VRTWVEEIDHAAPSAAMEAAHAKD
jgi:hypothetical protein